MALPDLTGQFIQDTYKRVLTVGEGGNMFDGTGSLFIPLSASHEIIKEVSSSYADTSSLAQELVSDKRATAKNYVYIAHGTTLQSGTTAALYLGTSHAGMDIARLNDSSLVLGGVTQNYGWRIFGIKHGLQGSTYTTEIDNLIATGSMKVTGSIDMDGNLDVEGNTIITGSLNTTGSLAAFDNDVLLGRIATSPQQPDRSLTIHSYSDSAIIFQNHGTWSKTKLYSSFNGTLILDEQGGNATPGGRLILGGSGDTGTNKENYLWIRGDNDDDAVHIYLGANSTTYSSEIGIERQEGTGINYESDIALRAAAGLSQHKSEYIFSRKGMFQAQDAGFTVSGSGQVFVNIATSSINPTLNLGGFSETFVVSGSGRFTDALSVDGTTRTLFTSCSMVYSGSNVTQITQSYEAGTQQITNIIYSGSFADGNPLSISVTGSDGVNKLYSMTYSGGNITQILVT